MITARRTGETVHGLSGPANFDGKALPPSRSSGHDRANIPYGSARFPNHGKVPGIAPVQFFQKTPFHRIHRAVVIQPPPGFHSFPGQHCSPETIGIRGRRPFHEAQAPELQC